MDSLIEINAKLWKMHVMKISQSAHVGGMGVAAEWG